VSHLPPDRDLGFRRRLRFARKRRGLDQREVAERAGASNAYVCQLESGLIKSPSIDWAAALAEALGVTASWLCFGEGAEPVFSAVIPDRKRKLYFVRRESDGAIKIGLSRNPKARLGNLRVATPDRLSLLGTVDGDYARERELHKRFADSRIAGEWFEPTDELLALINDEAA
jgi:transcriptional regulator with XRE-family HTH domain